MPYLVTFQLDAFNGTRDVEESLADLSAMLDCLIAIDTTYLRFHPETPLLYQSRVRYQDEPLGAEFWRDIPTVLAHGEGDCLPLTTNVLRADGTKVPLASLKVGDMIMGDGRMATVLEVCATGRKPILEFYLGDEAAGGKTRHPPRPRWLRCSPEHRLIMKDGEELRAKDVQIGRDLMTLEKPGKVMAITQRKVGKAGKGGDEQEIQEECGDIKTDIGRFYLPDADAVVHNCEDLACWLIAEKRVRFGLPARPIIIPQLKSNGRYLYHINVATPDVSGGVDDPSRRLGMK